MVPDDSDRVQHHPPQRRRVALHLARVAIQDLITAGKNKQQQKKSSKAWIVGLRDDHAF